MMAVAKLSLAALPLTEFIPAEWARSAWDPILQWNWGLHSYCPVH